MRPLFFAASLLLSVACLGSRGGEHDACRPSTAPTGGCDDGLICQFNSCEAPHSRAAGGLCSVDEICNEGLVCNGRRGRCELPQSGKPGDPCSSSVNCASGLVCGLFATCSDYPKDDAGTIFPPADAAADAPVAPDAAADVAAD
jgi:hypothetical protein